ncbi:unnamed protein product [Mytilus coruscus]|uniref:Integrase catalytic domain-containing protein n=1 Tax=Mytilus coruscus TaxID=42192 RepID=A0A6J8B3L1_MYTCO|nr:unnamed protein product [Mytilus coruscus]
MQSYVVGVPFERIATDIAGPFSITDDKNCFILVVGDYFSKLTEAYAMPDIQAKTVANMIFRAWIKRYGCPIEVHSDQGKQYESALFKELCTLLEINKTRTTPFHPRTDGNKKAKWFKENNEERIPVEIPNLTEFSTMTSQDQQNDKKSDTRHPLITDERDDDVKSTQEEEIGNEMKDVITDRD